MSEILFSVPAPKWAVFLASLFGWTSCITLGVVDIGIVERKTSRGLVLFSAGVGIFAANLNMMGEGL